MMTDTARSARMAAVIMLFASVVAVSGCATQTATPTPLPPTAVVATPTPAPTPTATTPARGLFPDPLNATYTIQGQPVTLTNGRAEQDIVPGAATKIRTAAFGEPAIGDLNGDGANDTAMILTQDPGGSGTFFYVVAGLRDRGSGQTIGTNGILLGDRIAPQNIAIERGVIVVNYADRAKDEPMTTQPHIGVTKRLGVRGTVLEEVELPK